MDAPAQSMQSLSPTADSHTRPDAPRPLRIHLPYLDGMRGAAAIYVVCFHNAEEWLPHTSGLARMALAPFRFGHYAVILFIALSGFCLMLPVVQASGHTLPGGRRQFFRRRARRILPGYYAALLVSLLLPFASAHGLKDLLTGRINVTHYPSLAHFSFANLLAHVFLVYNWHPDWAGAFNWPLWSVATEFQIYILFALLLLPAWRRFGSIGAVGLAWGLGVCPLIVSPHWNLSWTFPWMVGVFAFGMAGAQWVGERRPARWAAPLGLACVGIFGVLYAVMGIEGISSSQWFMGVDLLVGMGATALIIWCAQQTSQRSPLVRLLESPPLLYLGTISYSIYLLHVPIMEKLSGVNSLTERLHLPVLLRILIWFVFILACILAFASLSYRYIEQPFLKRRSAQRAL